MAIFPVNLPVGNSVINYATAQPVACRDGKIWFEQKAGIPVQFCIDGKVRKVSRTSIQKPFATIGDKKLFLITTREVERLFLTEPKVTASQSVAFAKIREAGSLRSITKGRAKVAAAPTEDDWHQATVYRIVLPTDSSLFILHSSLLSITYRGDCARLYANGRLVADNFYYGRPFLLGLWRLPADCTELELRILPLQPDAPIYLPREADRTPGEAVLDIKLLSNINDR